MPWARRLLSAALIGGMILLVYLVLEPFLASVAWAATLACITWPALIRLRTALGGRTTVSALLAVASLGATLVLPLLLVTVLIQKDLTAGYNVIAPYLTGDALAVPDFIVHIPWIGNSVHDWLIAFLRDPTALPQNWTLWFKQGASQVFTLLGGIGRNAAKLALALVTLFFFYRDGEVILRQVRSVLHGLLGERIDDYLTAASDMSRAIVQSVLLASFAQGAIAALGYWLIGVNAPVLLGVGTAIASVVPLFGTVLIWGPVSIGLMLTNHLWQGLAMIAWGTLLIHPTDNFIRPLFISSATKIPVLLIMFGVLGGLAAFGLIGLFIGPVILAVAFAVWREWVHSFEGAPNSAGGNN